MWSSRSCIHWCPQQLTAKKHMVALTLQYKPFYSPRISIQKVSICIFCHKYECGFVHALVCVHPLFFWTGKSKLLDWDWAGGGRCPKKEMSTAWTDVSFIPLLLTVYSSFLLVAASNMQALIETKFNSLLSTLQSLAKDPPFSRHHVLHWIKSRWQGLVPANFFTRTIFALLLTESSFVNFQLLVLLHPKF